MSDDTTRTTRLTILIAGNAVVFSRLYDLEVSNMTAFAGFTMAIVPIIGMAAPYFGLRHRSFALGEFIGCLCIALAMASVLLAAIFSFPQK